jgi:hypothetical protein
MIKAKYFFRRNARNNASLKVIISEPNGLSDDEAKELVSFVKKTFAGVGHFHVGRDKISLDKILIEEC